jgi:hypothetical protein
LGASLRRLQSFIIRGGGAPDVKVSLPGGGGQELTSDAAEVGRIALEQPRERTVVLESAGRSGPAPELAEHRDPAFESVGVKQTAPEQGSSDRPTKRTGVYSKM